MIERAVRLLLGLGLGAWALMQPALGMLEAVAVLAASFLVLNTLFGRCYLWALFKVNSCEQRAKSSGRGASG